VVNLLTEGGDISNLFSKQVEEIEKKYKAFLADGVDIIIDFAPPTFYDRLDPKEYNIYVANVGNQDAGSFKVYALRFCASNREELNAFYEAEKPTLTDLINYPGVSLLRTLEISEGVKGRSVATPRPISHICSGCSRDDSCVFMLKADPDDEVAEKSEANNDYSVYLQVT
jgi:hypothetical protein